MYTSIENVKLTEVETEKGKWKGKKFVHHKNPIEKEKKVVFEDNYSNLLEVASEIKHASERRPDRVIRVSFDVTAEW
ncbi:hypothetical protein P105_gp07 [Pelagibacter phage HTVC105P]|nr:hypothetical protein P105_gp07 [Pelagibacter phage HTVC105P]